jgi:hypothetical protein
MFIKMNKKEKSMENNSNIRKKLFKENELEQYVKYVYETLLNLKGENIIVSTNAILIGRTGAKHEIDIFYQFSKAGITHKVAIECKDRKEALAKGEVQEFFGKIEDISNIIGVIVARNGFQSGAEIYGKYKGILLLKTNELPTILDLISKKITKFFLPDTNDIGEPFWTPFLATITPIIFDISSIFPKNS